MSALRMDSPSRPLTAWPVKWAARADTGRKKTRNRRRAPPSLKQLLLPFPLAMSDSSHLELPEESAEEPPIQK